MVASKNTREKDVSKTKDEIIKESKRIEESCLYSAKGHFQDARLWRAFHLSIGIPTVILSAVAGASTLSHFKHSESIAAVSSILVAVLTALMTFLNPNKKSNTHLDSGNRYDSLHNKARRFWSITCRQEESEELLTEKLERLSEDKDRLNQNSPQISPIGYRFGKWGIESGQASYKVDKVEEVKD